MYYQPTTIKKALEIKAELGSRGTFVAGATDLLVRIRRRQTVVENFVDLSRIPVLAELEEKDDYLKIGAMVTLAQLEDSRFGMLAEAVSSIAGPQIRNRATVGGHLCSGSMPGDLSVALLACKAEVTLVSSAGSRRLHLEEFFQGNQKTVLRPDEMVHNLFVQFPKQGSFCKLGKRKALTPSLVVAAAVKGPKGHVAIGLGCGATRPVRAIRAETYLMENGLDHETMKRAAEIAGEDISPVTDFRAGAEYRRAMSKVLVKRVLGTLDALES